MSRRPEPVDALLWYSARLYARAYGRFKDRTGRNLKGLGFVLRRLQGDREFEAGGFRWFFDHRIASAYMRLVGGGFNEPETHAFLRYVADCAPQPVTFVDVGANIGELVVALAAHAHVGTVIAFEPHPVCSAVCRRNVALNHLSADVRGLLIADGAPQPYLVDTNYAPTSGIRRDTHVSALTPSHRLDDVLEVDGDCILLVDVEGAELDVLKGACALVQQVRPLIVFEYSSLIQRGLFTLADVLRVVGPDYELFRLRADGYLDSRLADTWNCVAVHQASMFAPICRARLKR